jgi:hypothetical protein
MSDRASSSRLLSTERNQTPSLLSELSRSSTIVDLAMRTVGSLEDSVVVVVVAMVRD